MKLKVIFVLLWVLFLVSVAAIDRCQVERKKWREIERLFSKSISSKATSSITEGAAKIVGISSLGMAAKSTTKNKHIDDNLKCCPHFSPWA